MTTVRYTVAEFPNELHTWNGMMKMVPTAADAFKHPATPLERNWCPVQPVQEFKQVVGGHTVTISVRFPSELSYAVAPNSQSALGSGTLDLRQLT
mmetsp:Transcript_26214/g.48003  ORF Transcript_26214/g.48003 Transcript_26214/m.48003 type:complete len:95 (-) Transcript_26214:2237-2521(-)